VTAALRYDLALLAASRAALAPLTAFLLVLAGVYAYDDSEVRPTYALTALLLTPVASWLALAVAHAEPEPQRQAALVARGSPARLVAGRAAALALVVAALAAVDVALPALLGRFLPAPTASELAAAALAHAAAGTFGVALGLLLGPPQVARRATAFGALVAYAIASVPLLDVLGPLAPPAWLAERASAEGVAPVGHVLAPALWSLALVPLLVAAAARLAARRA
jgi:hypothetical protein